MSEELPIWIVQAGRKTEETIVQAKDACAAALLETGRYDLFRTSYVDFKVRKERCTKTHLIRVRPKTSWVPTDITETNEVES